LIRGDASGAQSETGPAPSSDGPGFSIFPVRRPFFIVGSTAVGKSEIAAEVAARCDGEIVGADAFQIYEGFPLLTAKPSPETLCRVSHHLIGTVSLTEDYSVARYGESARQCLESIAGRGRTAIVVGGSGLYVKALTHGLSPLPPAQPELRAELDGADLEALNARLRSLDPAAADFIDRKNKRRVVRALEVCLTIGGRFSDHRALWSSTDETPSLPSGVVLTRDRRELCERIDRRVEAMFQQGALEEVRGTPPERIGPTASRIIGLADIRAYLDGAISRRECVERIQAATRQYAKRQTTWFKRETIFATLDLTQTHEDEAVSQILALLRSHQDQQADAPASIAPGAS
jgi:tRNA dimethylallyltransferase